jgi:hypothetical protein
MSNEDKMLRIILSDSKLSSYYEYNAGDFPTIECALRADNPIIVAVAKIIRGLNGSFDKSIQKEIYNEVFNYLNQNIL